ncbi:MAG: class I SAM-dependent methyltransferase, partial [Deltaproteobacteria bacterium]|nr:class I SAM-dependent methyltransferase [Deltaproteobacteria bacterium]
AAQHAGALAAISQEQEGAREQRRMLLGAVQDLRDTAAWLRTQTEILRRRHDYAPPATPPGAAAPPREAARQTIDAWMVAAAFRGDEAELRERQRRYVPLFAGRRRVVDLGCGRGEFLDLLREAGVQARGVDADLDMALWCQEKGLEVTCADALTVLEQLEPGSLDGVFCAQVVEHLPTADMLRLLELAARALEPGGLLVVETLNPESLLVLYRWFWADLTHQRLVHPESLRQLFAALGLHDVRVEFVPPPEGAVRLPVLELAGADAERLAAFNRATQYLNDLLYGSFDYAVIGVR